MSESDTTAWCLDCPTADFCAQHGCRKNAPTRSQTTPPPSGYTVGDIVAGMKRALKHVISKDDRRALETLTETTWTQLGVGAMLGTLHDVR